MLHTGVVSNAMVKIVSCKTVHAGIGTACRYLCAHSSSPRRLLGLLDHGIEGSKISETRGITHLFCFLISASCLLFIVN